jgi:hypothetical protein
MSSLEDKQIKDTYQGLVKTTDNGELPASGRVVLTDGMGNDSAISIGRAGEGIAITGGISGATLELGAKTFSLNSLTPPPTYTDPLQISFYFTGEVPEVVEVKVFKGYSGTPDYVQLINNPTHLTVYDIFQNVEFPTAEYFCELRALYADNTYVTDRAPFLVINNREGTFTTTLDGITLYNSSNYTSSNYYQYITERYQSFSSTLPQAFPEYLIFIEAEYTITLSPIDFVEQTFQLVGQSIGTGDPGSVSYRWYDGSGSNYISYPDYYSVQTPPFQRISDGVYKIYLYASVMNNYNQLNVTEKALDIDFRLTQVYATLFEERNKLGTLSYKYSRIKDEILNVSSYIPTIPNQIYSVSGVNMDIVVSPTLQKAKLITDHIGVDLTQGYTLTTLDATGTTVLWTFTNTTTAQQITANFDIPNWVADTTYILRYEGFYYDSTPFTTEKTVTLWDSIGVIDSVVVEGLTITPSSTLTKYNPLSNQEEDDVRYVVKDSLGVEVPTVNETKLGTLGNYINQYQYQNDLLDQTYEIDVLMPPTTTPGTYTLELQFSDRNERAINGSGSWRVADTTTFIIT